MVLTSAYLAQNWIPHQETSRGIIVTHSLNLESGNITSLGALYRVGADLFIRGTKITDFGNLTGVSGWVFMDGAGTPTKGVSLHRAERIFEEFFLGLQSIPPEDLPRILIQEKIPWRRAMIEERLNVY
jgi:hypothetical protein